MKNINQYIIFVIFYIFILEKGKKPIQFYLMLKFCSKNLYDCFYNLGLLNQRGIKSSVWLGGNDIETEGSWVWSDNKRGNFIFLIPHKLADCPTKIKRVKKFNFQ